MILGEEGFVFATIGVGEGEAVNGAMTEAVQTGSGAVVWDDAQAGEDEISAHGGQEGEEFEAGEGLVIDNS